MKFKVSDRLLGALSGLLIVALGLTVALVGSGLFPSLDLSTLIYGPYETWQRAIIIGVAVVLVLLGLHGLRLLFRRRDYKGFIVQRTDMGDMSIAISALSSMVKKCVDQHPEITVKKTRIHRVRGGIIVDLKILLASGINIPLTVNVLQKQIKQYITSCSGIDVHEVIVQIGTNDVALPAKEEVPALEEAAPVAALQDQTEAAADSILRHTEEPADYVAPVEVAPEADHAIDTAAEELFVSAEEAAVEVAPAAQPEVTADAAEAMETIEEVVVSEEVPVYEAAEPVIEAIAEEAAPITEAVQEAAAVVEESVADDAEFAPAQVFEAAEEEVVPEEVAKLWTATEGEVTTEE